MSGQRDAYEALRDLEHVYTASDASQKLSTLIDLALSGKRVIIARRKHAVVLVSMDTLKTLGLQIEKDDSG